MKISKSKKTGFTLVEMVVTMMIIVTLALLSFPLYEARSSEKSKLAEGYALLGVIVDAQIAYYNEYGMFLANRFAGYANANNTSGGFTCENKVLGINAINNRYFTYFTANAFTGDSLERNVSYNFTAAVKSSKAGTIYLAYDLTQRHEPVVSGI